MKKFRPSATALRVAMQRAAHQLLDDPKVFDDPIALRMIGKKEAAAMQADPHRFEAIALSSHLRAFVAVRSRYAEDVLALGIRWGIRQYVIVGAGLDTFAYRNPYRQGILRVFEVDHPATQNWKRSRFDALARGVASAGEPWQTFFDPGLLAKDLLAMGFGYAEDNGPEEINARYFANRRDGLRVGCLSHLMKARV